MATVEKSYLPDGKRTGIGTGPNRSGDAHGADHPISNFGSEWSAGTIALSSGDFGKGNERVLRSPSVRYLLDVPKFATVLRTKFEWVAGAATLAQDLTAFKPRVGFLSFDTKWDSDGETQGWFDFAEPYCTVESAAAATIAESNPNLADRELVQADGVIAGRVNWGISFPVGAAGGGPHTLDNVRFRIARGVSKPGVNLKVEVWPIGSGVYPTAWDQWQAPAGIDPKLDLSGGTPLAVSDLASWDSVPVVAGYVAAETTFSFSGGDRISLAAGQLFGVRIVRDDATYNDMTDMNYLVNEGTPDTGPASDGQPLTVGNGVYGLQFTGGPTGDGTENGFGGTLYHRAFSLPRVGTRDSATIIPGSCFQDALVPGAGLDISLPGGWVQGTLYSMGDAAYSPTYTVAELTQLVQDYIDQSAYDETGYPAAMIWRPAFATSGGTATISSGTMKLVIEYETPDAPSQATNPSPANAGTCVAVAPTLSWTTGARAVTHEVYFGTTMTPPLVATNTEFDLDHDPGTLSQGQTYFWRIDEVNSAGTTAGVLWSFTVGEPAAKATNPDPAHLANDATPDVVLSWTAGAGCPTVSHDVYFGTNPDPSGDPQGNQAGTTFDPAGLLDDGQTYYWRIDEVNTFGTTPGDVWQFTVAQPSLGHIVGNVRVVPAVSASTPRVRPAVSGKARVRAVKAAAPRAWPSVGVSVGVRPAVSGRARVFPVKGVDLGVQAAVNAGACVRPAVAGGVRVYAVKGAQPRAAPAVGGAVRVKPAVDGDVRVRSNRRPEGRPGL